MKLMSFRRPDGAPSWGIVKEQGVIDLGHLAPSLKHALWATTSLAERAAGHADYKLTDVHFLPPIPDPDKILCVGLNYVSHIKEGGREPPPKASETYDYEGELAVVIGQRCRHVPKDRASEVIAGYACYNEGSVREWQRHSAQFIPGKNFYHSGAFGPWIVTPEEAGDITRATLLTRLDGQEVQRATIDDLCFDIPTLIEYVSTFTQLEAGDVIVTGTTGGVGAYRKPPLWMKHGDVSGVGVLRNTVAQEE